MFPSVAGAHPFEGLILRAEPDGKGFQHALAGFGDVVPQQVTKLFLGVCEAACSQIGKCSAGKAA